MGLFDVLKKFGSGPGSKPPMDKALEAQKIIDSSNLVLDYPNFLLKNNEKLLYSRPADFLQERMVRQYRPGSRGIEFGSVRIGSYQGSHQSC